MGSRWKDAPLAACGRKSGPRRNPRVPIARADFLQNRRYQRTLWPIDFPRQWRVCLNGYRRNPNSSPLDVPLSLKEPLHSAVCVRHHPTFLASVYAPSPRPSRCIGKTALVPRQLNLCRFAGCFLAAASSYVCHKILTARRGDALVLWHTPSSPRSKTLRNFRQRLSCRGTRSQGPA